MLYSVYRSPKNTGEALDADFDTLEAQYQHVLLHYPGCAVAIMGDMNCDMAAANTHPARRKLTEFLTTYSMSQLVTDPTYTSGSLLDVCIVNRDIVTRVSTRHCDFSPHRFIRAVCHVPRPRRTPTVVQARLLRSIDTVSYHRDLLSCDFGAVFGSASVDDMWNALAAIVRGVTDRHAPLRNLRLRNPEAPPISDRTRALIIQRAAALRVNGHGSQEYRDVNRAVRSAIRADTRRDIADRIQTQGANTVWRNMRHIISGKTSNRSVSPAISAESLNEYFVSVGPRVSAEVAELGDAPDVPTRLPRVGACSFTLQPISLTELYHIVFTMRNSAACGEDGLCIRVFKLAFHPISPALLHIVNMSLTTSDIPDAWKHALVHPIFKSGDFDSPSNYRPISILPVISKIVEKAVQRQLQHYLSSNHLLAPNQHGFRPRHSTETALLNISDRALSAMDKTQISLLCLIDLSKCFDVISHSKLITKLQLNCIDTTWFKNYLSGHTQSVSLWKSQVSAPRPITQGVFQGSSLGPLLFTIFSNDLSLHAAEAFVVQYADDTQVLVSGPKSSMSSLIASMEASLSSLDNNFRSNGLKINETKFELLPLGTRQNLRNLPAFSVKFRDVTLTPCTEARNLGVTFDRYLSWDCHVFQLSKKMRRNPCWPLSSPASSSVRYPDNHCFGPGLLTHPVLFRGVWKWVGQKSEGH